MNNFKSVTKIEKVLHGADYNPEQWLHRDFEKVIDEDVRLMKKANCNVVAINMFGWATIEPEEGKYNFECLDYVFEKLGDAGISIILSTPSGARPVWLSLKYKEVLRVNKSGRRNYHGGRHNHCYSSIIYRTKVREINSLLAKRYGDKPNLIAWHVSNEYGGDCYCDLCTKNFQKYLKEKYKTIENLNNRWWTTFWSYTYNSFEQIEPPFETGARAINALLLDWHRFRTYQTIEFYKNEIIPLRELTPNIPITTNFDEYVDTNSGLNYWEFKDHVDFISWDNYPYWHGERENRIEGARRGFIHDINRSLKNGKPFFLMESSPSATNWQPIAKLRRPGMQQLASLQAVAHGSDSVQYFQWRKGLGSFEKFHGAVIDHYPTTETRIFKEVSEVGNVLTKLDEVVGTSVDSEVAIIYDWENMWAYKGAVGFNNKDKSYFELVVKHYQTFWENGISCDILDMNQDLSKYKLVIAPMLYMVTKTFSKNIEEFVKSGGTFVSTYLSGIVDETDLCFTNGRPGPLKDVLGIWSEEIDCLYENDFNRVEMLEEKEPLNKVYKCEKFCDLIHLQGATSLAEYKDDFYKGFPALTKNSYEKGEAYYIAFDGNDDFLEDFYNSLIDKIELQKALKTKLPKGVTAQIREDKNNKFVFIQNYTSRDVEIDLGDKEFEDVIESKTKSNLLTIEKYYFKILKLK